MISMGGSSSSILFRLSGITDLECESMAREMPADFMDQVQRSLESAWEHEGKGYKDGDWGAVYMESLARPCLGAGLAVACTLGEPSGGFRPEVSAYVRHRDQMHSPEQALDFLAIDASALTPVLGAEIEWKADQTTKYVEEDAKILRDVWGEPQVPEKGHVVAALYDLGRLLMVNPPYMVLEVYPPADGVGL